MTKKIAGLTVLIVLLFVLLVNQGAAETPTERPCKTVTAKTFNKRVRTLEQIAGKNLHNASRKVCKPYFEKLEQRIQSARRSCVRRAITTGATWYGGAGDSMTSGTAGAYGDLSGHPWSFAELGMGRAMGGLKPLSWWYVHSKTNHRTKRAQKRDIGGGGGAIGGYTRGLDAWHPLARYLGLMGNGIVQLSRRNCWA